MRGSSRLACELRNTRSQRFTSSYEPPQNMRGDCSRARRARRRRPPRPPAEPIAAPESGGGCAVAGRCARAGGAAGSAFVEPARQALLAAFLVDEGRLPALLAEVADLLSRVDGRGGLGRRLQLADVLGEGARECVRE